MILSQAIQTTFALMPVQLFCLALPPSFLALLVALLPIDLCLCISGFLHSVFFPG
jgi:hypothetical protein